jgi:purine-nucleoside phosphorylase
MDYKTMNLNTAISLEKVEEAADFLVKTINPFPEIAIIVGSGLGGFLKGVERNLEIDYSQIPHFPVSTVSGHSGKLIFGSVGNSPQLAIMAGRKHLYEGISAQDAVFAVRVLGQLGIKILILTNAAGGLNMNFIPGDLMLISDQINFMYQNPLTGPNVDEWGERFPDMSSPYDRELKKIAISVAVEKGIALKEGVYAAGTGPTYETKAEVTFLKFSGADAIGMSTIPENIAANHMGIRVLGISYISNSLVLDQTKKTTHKEVLENARLVEKKFADLLCGILDKIC